MTETAPTTTLLDYSGTWEIDPSHTTIGFRVRHAMVTTVHGQFTSFTGSLTLDGEQASQSSAQLHIDVASITTANEQRDEHLRSADFFDVANHPAIVFTSTSVSVTGEEFTVVGNLTIKEVTAPVTLTGTLGGVATDPFGNVRAGFEASAAIERRDFGLTWNAPLDKGGWLVSERVTITLDVSAIRQA